MEQVPAQSATFEQQAGQAKNGGALIIITVLFFIWGLLTSLNDVLIPHLKMLYTLTYVEAMLVQLCFFSAYFIVSLPAGMLLRKIGYQHGVVTGLIVAASGCALFYPASTHGYVFFLLAFFVLASGVTILQVAANPFVTALGDPKTASSRLTLTQAFNSLGTTVAPTLGGLLILSAALTPTEVAKLPAAGQLAYRAQEATAVQGPYLVLAAILAILAFVFASIRLPQIKHEQEAQSDGGVEEKTSVLGHRHLVLGAIAIFLYVGGEVSVGSFMINFIGEPQITGLPAASAAHFVSYYWGGAMLGRFFGVAIMRYISPGKVLAFNATCSILLILTAIFSHGHLAMWSLIAVGLCNSIMFPTIFSMALNKLGRFTGDGSGILCMAIVGGAIVPFIQGALADTVGLQSSFVVPAACYTFILFFGWKYADMFKKKEQEQASDSATH